MAEIFAGLPDFTSCPCAGMLTSDAKISSNQMVAPLGDPACCDWCLKIRVIVVYFVANSCFLKKYHARW